MSKLKKQTWRWCAKYIKLRDAIEDLPITKDISLVQCRTCKKWLKTNSKNAQSSHYIGRGLGGSSGVYFDERNIHITCYQCNWFLQGNQSAFKEFMLKKYGQGVIDELEVMHQTNSYKGRIWAIGQMYKEMYQELQAGINGR